MLVIFIQTSVYDYNQRHYSSVYSTIDAIAEQSGRSAHFVVLTPVVPQFSRKVPRTVFRFFESEADLKSQFFKSVEQFRKYDEPVVVYAVGHSSKQNGLKLFYHEFTKLDFVFSYLGALGAHACVVLDTCYAARLQPQLHSPLVSVYPVVGKDEQSFSAELTSTGYFNKTENAQRL